MTAQDLLRRALAEHQAGCLAAAAEAYRAFLAVVPANPAGHLQLGVVLRQLGLLAEAEASYRQALALRPDCAEAHGNLAICLNLQGRFEEAAACAGQALVLKSDLVAAHFALGLARQQQGRLAEAEAAYRQALVLAPAFAEAAANLGAIYLTQGRFPEAAQQFAQALALSPQLAEAHSNLGAACKELGMLYTAEGHLRAALVLRPDYADAHNNLGATLTAMGRLDEAVGSLRRALATNPGHLAAHSNLLYALNFAGHAAAVLALAAAQHYGTAVLNRARQAGGPFMTWHCDPAPRRLRVGVVSGDLRSHPVGYFLEGLLAQLDKNRLELIAYPTHACDDALGVRLCAHFSAWRPIYGLDDASAARLIHADGVHVLLDLSGHTGGNRLSLFAWKPAQVQASWLGYFATTGVAAMDYLLADEVGVPPEARALFTEQIWYLPDTRLCFTPPENAPAVSPAPTLRHGSITFGSMQSPARIGDAVLSAWARILRALPSARLRLQNKLFAEARMSEAMTNRLQAQEIDPGRVSLHAALPRADYLAAYAEVDVMLDTFPYPGGTTTCEALWMGVPTLTLAGKTLLERQGASILMAAGLPDWVAANMDDYVNKAIALAGDIPRLAALRVRLRDAVRSSPLFDAQRFARQLETSLWDMWHEAMARSTDTQRQFTRCLDDSIAAQSAGNPRRALECAQAALRLIPCHPAALNNVGAFAALCGENASAIAAYRRLTEVCPRQAEGWHNLAYFLQQDGSFVEAEAAYRRALEIKPDYADAYDNLGLLLLRLGRWPEAKTAFRQSLIFGPDNPSAHNHLGDLLRMLGCFDEAEAALLRALELAPDHTDACNNLGILRKHQGCFAEAESCYRRAIKLAPSNARAWCNLGNLLKETGHAADAEAAYLHALGLAPDLAEARMNLALLLLRQGRWAEAWPLHEARYSPQLQARKILPPPFQPERTPPRWAGESLRGKSLLLWPEQGFGDEIQFVRFLSSLNAQGLARLTLVCKDALIPLFAGQAFVDEVIAVGQWRPEMTADYDCWAFLMSLPLFLGLTVDSIPAALPYLAPNPERIRQWRKRLPTQCLRVGLAWKGNPGHKNDTHRSLPGLHLLEPLWSVGGVSFVSLQRNAGDEIRALETVCPMLDFGDRFDDFADSAAVIAQLDLVICVDTVIAHLAGALGKACWVMLPAHDTDWRWLSERDDSPWYPRVMRLFRQSERGDWHGVIDRVTQALAQYGGCTVVDVAIRR